ncbi:hypothetical protein N7510_000262 [Penicillium lagena]|uniref:uncharacterized protein n=1 Tax=Penicillium lagena TaxID=94218 RepID=UPI00253FC810|nr:uncharacterized protein N7510_000262 [Penicillium lagena]KAJ5623953.1 hypothetical protein N7510_000262 [Penicillium lagena]
MSAQKECIESVDPVKGYTDDIDLLSSREKQIMRRVDLRLVAATALGYSVNLMDRGNVGMAAIAGMLKDLDFVGYRYSLIVLMFFVTYVIFQPPATVLIRKIGPPYFLSAIIFSWGILMLGMGFAQSWSQVLAIRVLLGVFAAGYFPGCMYLLSCWYRRYEVQKRFSVFYGVGCVASALAGILAYGLMQMDGAHGIAGWRWILILEGVITVGLSVLCYLLIVDFPDRASRNWRFLTEEECAFVVRRINRDRLDAEAEEFTMKRFLRPALDIKIWAYAVMFGCLTINTYAMAYFLPIILSDGMGFGVGESQCLTAPPWVFAALVMYATAWVGDKIQRRVPILLFNVCLSIIGLPMMGFLENNAARYVGVFLTVAGANANVPACMAWQANNIRGQWTRAFSSATLIGFDGIGGIIASLVFEKDAPQYRPGVFTALGANILLLLIVVSLALWYRHCNKQADRGERIIAGVEGFRYTI